MPSMFGDTEKSVIVTRILEYVHLDLLPAAPNRGTIDRY